MKTQKYQDPHDLRKAAIEDSMIYVVDEAALPPHPLTGKRTHPLAAPAPGTLADVSARASVDLELAETRAAYVSLLMRESVLVRAFEVAVNALDAIEAIKGGPPIEVARKMATKAKAATLAVIRDAALAIVP